MDIERTMEFIVEQQARFSADMAKAEARMDRTDRQIAGLQKLARMGLKAIVSLTAAQKATDHRLDRLIRALEGTRTNGRRSGSR